MADDAKIIRDILNTQWNAGNVAKPTFYYDDSIKNHDYRTDAVKVYLVDRVNEIGDVSYSYRRKTVNLRADIRCSDRDRMLLLRDEVIRCLDAVRTSPNAAYNYLKIEGERQVTGYAKFWHYVIDVVLKDSGRTIST